MSQTEVLEERIRSNDGMSSGRRPLPSDGVMVGHVSHPMAFSPVGWRHANRSEKQWDKVAAV